MNVRDILKLGFIGNASGPRCTTKEELEELFSSDADFVVTKSVTVDRREGNPYPRVAHGFLGEISSINSVGLANPGVREMKRILGEIEITKPLVVSIASSPSCPMDVVQQYRKLAEELGEFADVLEVNISCPNLGKRMISNDPETTSRILEEVAEIFPPERITVKVPPYSNVPELFQNLVCVLREHRIRAVSAINSLPSCMYIDIEREESLIKPNNGYGGFGGRCILPLVLGEVNRWYRKGFYVIGVGGISCGADWYRHILAGSSAVQVGTAYLVEGTSVFTRLKTELNEILKRKRASLERKIGAVKLP